MLIQQLSLGVMLITLMWMLPTEMLDHNEGKIVRKAFLGQIGEEIVDDILHKAFWNRTSLMWNGFEKDKLFKIA